MNYRECKEIALKKAERVNATIDKAYSIGPDYVFDSSTDEFAGVIPVVVIAETGQCEGLWQYLIDNDLTMDDMTEVEF